MTMTFFSRSTPSISARNWGTIVASISEEMPVPLVLKRASISSKKTITGWPASALAFSDIFIQKLGPLHVKKEAPDLFARPGPQLFGERGGDCFRDERFSAAGRTVKEDTLGRKELMLGEQLGVKKRKFHGVPDQFNLLVQAADVVVGDVGNLFQHHLFHFGLRQLLQNIAGADVEQEMVSDRDPLIQQRLREFDHPFFLGPQGHDRPVSFQDILYPDHF